MVNWEYLKFRIWMERKKILAIFAIICAVILSISLISYFIKASERKVPKERYLPIYSKKTIKIYSDKFEPSEIRIKPGEKVTWINLDTRFYTLVVPDKFEIVILPNDTFSFPFYKEGIYYFGVIENPNIQGKIIVA